MHDRLAGIFVLLVLPTGLFLCLAVPPGEVPDEPNHVARASSLLHGALLGRRIHVPDAAGNPSIVSGLLVNRAPAFATLEFPASGAARMTATEWQRLNAIPWSPELTYYHAPNTAIYFPVFYLPMAGGLLIGHILDVTPLEAVLLARMAAFLVFVAVGALALRIAERGQTLLFATLMLPMTLWLAASCNQDGLIVAFTCLAAALLTRANGPSGAHFWTAGAILACVFAVKPPYLPLASAMLVPCREASFSQLRRAAVGVVSTALPAVCWTASATRLAFVPYVRGLPYHPGPLWAGSPDDVFPATDPAAQLQVLMHSPMLAIDLPLRSMRDLGVWYLQSAVGYLGLLDIPLAGSIYALWFIAISLAALSCAIVAPNCTSSTRPVTSLVGFVSIAVAVLVIFNQQYLTWTPVGLDEIQGVQGRYFIPIVPMGSLFIPSFRSRYATYILPAMALPAVLGSVVELAYLPQLVICRYYM